MSYSPRSRAVACLVIGGLALVMCAGCDPQVRQTVLDAIEAGAVRIVTGLVQALFQIFQTATQTTTTTTTPTTPAAMVRELLSMYA